MGCVPVHLTLHFENFTHYFSAIILISTADNDCGNTDNGAWLLGQRAAWLVICFPLSRIRMDLDTQSLNNFLPACFKVSLINWSLLCSIFVKMEEAGSVLQL